MKLLRKGLVLGIDPGFSRVGYAVVSLDGQHVVAGGVIRTQKAAKKLRTYASDDNWQRAQLIGGRLEEILDAYPARTFCAEAMSFPRSASVAAKMAMCWGVLAEIARRRDLPLLQVRPQALKVAVCGKSTASKDEVKAAVLRRIPEAALYLPKATTLHEHYMDSVGAVLACLDSDVLRALRQLERTR